MMTSGILSKIIGQKTTKNLNKKENGMQQRVCVHVGQKPATPHTQDR